MGILTYNKNKHQTINKSRFQTQLLKLCIEQKSHGWVCTTLYRETLEVSKCSLDNRKDVNIQVDNNDAELK